MEWQRAAECLSHWLPSGSRPGAVHSPLTHTGDAFEPAFVGGAREIRYTIHPAPELLPTEQLPWSRSRLDANEVDRETSSLLEQLAVLQRLGEVRIGTQIGARHGPAGDRLKLYAEIPREAAEQAEVIATRALGRPPVLDVAGRWARLCMVGFELTNPLKEFYYRIENLHPWEVSTVLSRAGWQERSAELLRVIRQTQKVPIMQSLPGATWGMSYAAGPEGISAVAIYTFAATLFGPDHFVREGMLALADTFGWDLSDYDEISRPLSVARRGPPHHGIIGFVVHPGSPITPWIGIAPPPPCHQ